MTKLLKPVVRETEIFDRGERLVVELHPRHIEIRRKGDRAFKPLSVSIEGLYQRLCSDRVGEERRARDFERRMGRRTA